jgi:hypothetical protein
MSGEVIGKTQAARPPSLAAQAPIASMASTWPGSPMT